jgi:hypothetical protein
MGLPLSDASKRYTEREFSLILSKAAELAGSSSSVGRVEDGLTLEEITSIAVEAGLDADSIARAARLIPDEGQPSVLRKVMGGALRVQRAFDLPGELTNERAQRILNAARRAMQTPGIGDADSAGVSWTTGGVFVSGHGVAAETRVQVTVNYRAMLIGPILLGVVGAVATLYAAVAAGDSGFVNPYLVLAGGAGITAALAWAEVRRLAGKTRATLERLIEAIGESSDRERAS